MTGAYRILLKHRGYDWSIQDYRNIQNMTGAYRITGAFRILLENTGLQEHTEYD